MAERRTWRPEQDAVLMAAYQAGEPLHAIAAKVGRGETSTGIRIRRFLRDGRLEQRARSSVKRRRRPTVPAEEPRALSDVEFIRPAPLALLERRRAALYSWPVGRDRASNLDFGGFND